MINSRKEYYWFKEYPYPMTFAELMEEIEEEAKEEGPEAVQELEDFKALCAHQRQMLDLAKELLDKEREDG